MRRALAFSLRSCCKRSFSFSSSRFAAPAAKYLEIYSGDFETQSYPVQLLGGTHTSFAKMLYKFAEQAEGGNFDVYIEDFQKLSKIAADVGPFWIEQDVLNDPAFSALSPGFRFALGWMQSERMLDSLQNVKSSYQELVDALAKQIRATITVPWDPSSNRSEIERIEAEAKELYSARNPGTAPKVIFQIEVNPSLKDGYTFEIDNLFVNKSAAAIAASASAAGKDQIKDWTALPALPAKAVSKENDLLLKLIGAELDQLAEIDDVERRVGV
eukprot:RCo022840